MNLALSIIGFLVFFSGLRIYLGVDASEVEQSQARLAWVTTVVVASGIWLGAGPVVDAFEVSPPTLWVGAGLVIGLASLVGLARGMGKPWAVTAAPTSAVVPLFFPLLMAPELAVHSLATGADGRAIELVGILIAAALSFYVFKRGFGARLAESLYRIQSLVGVLLGVVWLVEGSRSLVL